MTSPQEQESVEQPKYVLLPNVKFGPKEYHCQHGHTWTSWDALFVSLGVGTNKHITTKPLCPYCIVAFLDANFAAEVVRPPTPDTPLTGV